jgi:hypothetical protein
MFAPFEIRVAKVQFAPNTLGESLASCRESFAIQTECLLKKTGSSLADRVGCAARKRYREMALFATNSVPAVCRAGSASVVAAASS